MFDVQHINASETAVRALHELKSSAAKKEPEQHLDWR